MQRTTKILFIIGTLEVGGAETQLVELASRLDRHAFEPVVCSLASGGQLEGVLRERGVRVHTLGFKGFRAGRWLSAATLGGGTATLWRLWRLMRRERPTIVHGILFWAYILGTILGRLAGVPMVVASRRSLGLFKAGKPHYLFLERMANRWTDVVIANSEAVRQDTLDRENLAPTRVVVVPNGVEPSKYEAGSGQVPPLSVSSGPRVIVVSNLIHYKGHDYFLRAWTRVLERFPSAIAVLVGDGAQRDYLEALAKELNIRDSVVFLGVRQDVPALLAAADIYVHPSLQEGCSNALLEAMSAGKPVIATAVGGNVEAIADGERGILVPPRDADALSSAIIRLMSDRTAARNMGRLANQFVRRHHNIDAMVQSYEGIYRRLVSMPDATRKIQRARADVS